jgi:hypothetical protein
VLKHNEESCKLGKNFKYQDEINYIIGKPSRNRFIKNLALSLEGNTLLLYQFVDKHGKVLYNMIKDAVEENRPVFFIHGAVGVDEREEVRRIMELCNEENIFLSFDDFDIVLEPNEIVDLINKKQKKAKEITEDDDIDTSIVINKIQSSILKGYIWKKKN